MIKQVIVMRTDLNMRKGKMIAQGAHASMKVFFDRMSKGKHPLISPFSQKILYPYTILMNEESSEWVEGLFTKIVVGCNSLEELLEIQDKAKVHEIPYAVIEDSGKTEFKQECKDCNGTGIFFDPITQTHMENMKCNKCNGTGKVNKPTITCIALGPDHAEKIDKITGELELL
ncbi:MAG TPA: peptidyl-tRNA hydrolase [Methanofastidiosum sp.]|nr:peptidyl-tRNA hydrolase [Methanofastidiosum sp.]